VDAVTTPQDRHQGRLSELALMMEWNASKPGTTGDVVVMIRRADELVKLSESRLQESVAAARRRGVSWQSIGDALGVTRQAAFKRFSTATENVLERKDMAQLTIDLTHRTEEVFHNLDKGDYDAVKAHMTYTCSRVLSKRKMLGLRGNITTATGRLETCASTTVQTPDGRSSLEKITNRHLMGGAVVQTTLQHEAGEWIGRVAYNGAGKITGILIAPPDSRDLPF
jgi:hypothetical protein